MRPAFARNVPRLSALVLEGAGEHRTTPVNSVPSREPAGWIERWPFKTARIGGVWFFLRDFVTRW